MPELPVNEGSVQQMGDHSSILVRCIQLEMRAWNRKMLVTSNQLLSFVYKETNLLVTCFNHPLSWVSGPLWALRLSTGGKEKKRSHCPIVGMLKHPNIAKNTRIVQAHFRTNRCATVPGGIARIFFPYVRDTTRFAMYSFGVPRNLNTGLMVWMPAESS